MGFCFSISGGNIHLNWGWAQDWMDLRNLNGKGGGCEEFRENVLFSFLYGRHLCKYCVGVVFSKNRLVLFSWATLRCLIFATELVTLTEEFLFS